MWVWCAIVVDAEWCDVDCGYAMSNMLCFEMWWCETVMGCRLRCNVMPDVEYGGPRRDVLRH